MAQKGRYTNKKTVVILSESSPNVFQKPVFQQKK